jgi:spore maturation protein CgeD
MLVNCVLLSYNRPKWIRHALLSVSAQTHPDYRLIVMDESTIFDVEKVVEEFTLRKVEIVKVKVPPEERSRRNPVSANMNAALSMISEGLVCSLCDDDYFYPTWFAAASRHFEEHPDHHAAFGILNYSKDPEMKMSPLTQWGRRFFYQPVTDPFCKLDHTQVIHRVFNPPYRWPEEFDKIKEPDAYYFREIARNHAFHPIRELAVVKREHEKALRWNVKAIEDGTLEASRE